MLLAILIANENVDSKLREIGEERGGFRGRMEDEQWVIEDV